jgi:2-iminobutanoate/2-iminopropanoate deaminase
MSKDAVMKMIFLVVPVAVMLSFLACSHDDTHTYSAKEIISTQLAPEAIGPYSQAVRVGDFLFLSGQIPIDPETGEILTGNIGAQTEQVLDNLGAVLDAADMIYGDIVHCSVFLADLEDFTAMNEVYARYFSEDPPSRATVEVSRLPRDVRVEISAIAVKTR